MLVKSSNIAPEMRDNYIINPLARKLFNPDKGESVPLLDCCDEPVIVSDIVDLQPRKEYNQNCIVRKISRKEYAYA